MITPPRSLTKELERTLGHADASPDEAREAAKAKVATTWVRASLAGVRSALEASKAEVAARDKATAVAGKWVRAGAEASRQEALAAEAQARTALEAAEASLTKLMAASADDNDDEPIEEPHWLTEATSVVKASRDSPLGTRFYSPDSSEVENGGTAAALDGTATVPEATRAATALLEAENAELRARLSRLEAQGGRATAAVAPGPWDATYAEANRMTAVAVLLAVVAAAAAPLLPSRGAAQRVTFEVTHAVAAVCMLWTSGVAFCARSR